MSADTINPRAVPPFLRLRSTADDLQNKIQMATRHQEDLQTLINDIGITLDNAENKIGEERTGGEPSVKRHLDRLHGLLKKVLEFVCMSESRFFVSSWWFRSTDAATIEEYRKRLDDWRKDFRGEASWICLQVITDVNKQNGDAHTIRVEASDVDLVRSRFDNSTSSDRSVIPSGFAVNSSHPERIITINGPIGQYTENHVHYHGTANAG